LNGKIVTGETGLARVALGITNQHRQGTGDLSVEEHDVAGLEVQQLFKAHGYLPQEYGHINRGELKVAEESLAVTAGRFRLA
jgi:ABC-type protease/lipase transport system fused ATPase/permease subunit